MTVGVKPPRALSVLLTGSHGFVGRHLYALFSALGFDVFCVDIASDTYPHDARSYFMRAGKRFDIAVHAAAYVGGREGIDGRPAFVGAYNAALDGAFFEWVLRIKPRHAVYLSSSAVYPVEIQQAEYSIKLYEDLIRFDDSYLPDSTYGAVKLLGERLAVETQAELGSETSVHVVRPFSGYGSDQDTAYPFGAFAVRASKREDPFTIWGDPTSVRDWIHIDDVCRGIMAVIEHDYLQPVNLCSGDGVSFHDLALMFAYHAKYEPVLKCLADMPMGVHTRVGDATRMLRMYTPHVSLDEGIARALSV